MFKRIIRFVLVLLLAAGTVLSDGDSFMLAPAEASAADDPELREYLIKAGFLYNFPKFTEWPAETFMDPSTPLTLCVLGEDPFGLALQSIDGKTVKDRRLVTTHVKSVADAQSCHVVFISASERPRFGDILAALGRLPVLTVSDAPGFAQSGGIIALNTVENRIRFQINLAAARGSGLKFSSKLLTLAEIVGKQQASAGETN